MQTHRHKIPPNAFLRAEPLKPLHRVEAILMRPLDCVKWVKQTPVCLWSSSPTSEKPKFVPAFVNSAMPRGHKRILPLVQTTSASLSCFFFLCVFFKNVFSFYRLNIPRFAWGLFGAMSLAARFFLLRIWIYGPFVSFTFTSSGGGISVYTVLILNLCTNSFEEGVKPFCWIFDFRENHKKKKKFTFKRAFGFIYN